MLSPHRPGNQTKEGYLTQRYSTMNLWRIIICALLCSLMRCRPLERPQVVAAQIPRTLLVLREQHLWRTAYMVAKVGRVRNRAAMAAGDRYVIVANKKRCRDEASTKYAIHSAGEISREGLRFESRQSEAGKGQALRAAEIQLEGKPVAAEPTCAWESYVTSIISWRTHSPSKAMLR